MGYNYREIERREDHQSGKKGMNTVAIGGSRAEDIMLEVPPIMSFCTELVYTLLKSWSCQSPPSSPPSKIYYAPENQADCTFMVDVQYYYIQL